MLQQGVASACHRSVAVRCFFPVLLHLAQLMSTLPVEQSFVGDTDEFHDHALVVYQCSEHALVVPLHLGRLFPT